MSKYTYSTNFKIADILEKDTNNPKLSHQYRIGRKGKIANLNIGTPLYFEYADEHGTLITSNVIDFEEDDYGVWVTTEKSRYNFEHIS